MRLYSHWILCGTLFSAAAVACVEDLTSEPRRNVSPNAGESETPPPGGELPDEQFPAKLLEPYTGAPIDEYDNTTLGYRQLRARVDRVFADSALGGNTDTFFADKIALLGGADFVQHFDEARVITPDFLLALDSVAKEACGRASINKSGPFVGTTPETLGDESALATKLYQRVLFRQPTAAEVTQSLDLVHGLIPMSPSTTSAWAGLCEALVRHQDFVFTLPPSVNGASAADKERLQLVKLATDFVGRPPTDEEFAALFGKTTSEKVEHFVGTTEFRDFYFHRARLRTESIGTPEMDEPARLWTYLIANGLPFEQLLTADFTVDQAYSKIVRAPEHGKTGILTMPGFIKTKPGLPHYNYPARVMSDYLGQLFEITPDIVAARVAATSTVEVGSSCISCHGVLTPLAHQRLHWADDGSYREKGPAGEAIDDSDGALVADYPYKGKGLAAFSEKAVKKERFLRQFFQSQFLFFMGRPMRFDQDERTTYLSMWRSAFKSGGNIKELLHIVASSPTYLGQ